MTQASLRLRQLPERQTPWLKNLRRVTHHLPRSHRGDLLMHSHVLKFPLYTQSQRGSQVRF